MEALLPSLNQKVFVVSMPDNKGEVQVKAKDLRKTKETKVRRNREEKLNLVKVELRGLYVKAYEYYDNFINAHIFM